MRGFLAYLYQQESRDQPYQYYILGNRVFHSQEIEYLKSRPKVHDRRSRYHYHHHHLLALTAVLVSAQVLQILPIVPCDHRFQ